MEGNRCLREAFRSCWCWSAPLIELGRFERHRGRRSLGLHEITSLIDKSSQLKGEVAEALVKINKKADDIRCEGTRFSNRWRNLSGERASPYICNIGDKWLEIRATARVTGPRGRVFETITPEAMKNATDISETNPTWKWTDQDPRAPL